MLCQLHHKEGMAVWNRRKFGAREGGSDKYSAYIRYVWSLIYICQLCFGLYYELADLYKYLYFRLFRVLKICWALSVCLISRISGFPLGLFEFRVFLWVSSNFGFSSGSLHASLLWLRLIRNLGSSSVERISVDALHKCVQEKRVNTLQKCYYIPGHICLVREKDGWMLLDTRY